MPHQNIYSAFTINNEHAYNSPRTKRCIAIGLYKGSINKERLRLWSEVIKSITTRGITVINWTFLAMPEADQSIRHSDTPKISLTKEQREKWVERAKLRHGLSNDEALAIVSAIETEAVKFFDNYQPATFVGWNTLECEFGIPSDVAKNLGICVWCLEAGIIPGTIRVEQNNWANFISDHTHPSSTDIDDGEKLLSFLQTESFSVHSQRSSFIERARMHITNRQNILVLGSVESGAGQTPSFGPEKNDTLPFFRDSYEIAESLSLTKQWSVFFKPHPFGGGRSQARNNSRIRVVHSDPISLIKASTIVVSTAGKLEAATAFASKPLIRVGRSFLSGCRLGLEVNNSETLEKAVVNSLSRFEPAKQMQELSEALGFLYRNGWLIDRSTARSLRLDTKAVNSVNSWIDKIS